MAHFHTVVVLPPDTPDPLASARAQMQQFFHRDIRTPAEDGGNPNAKFDGFTVTSVVDDGPDDTTADRAVLRLGTLAATFTPFAVITADGTWHEKQKSDPKRRPFDWLRPSGGHQYDETGWSAKWAEICHTHKDHLAVVFDCHC